MSFITESKKAYRQVEALEKETSDHEISMARGELEGIADKALATSAMLQGVTESGNPLPAWVQSKITNASDYITSVHDYLKYTPGMNESFNLEENTFEKIYQMQQDGKSTEDIAKELKLNPALVKKVLGENTVISEGLSDAQIAQLKKEYEPLKGKTITTSQYQQLKNILFKLQDGDLEKLQKQNIPFASTGAGSILRVRKSPVKITSVKVPGLEGMAEEKIPQDYLDYLRTIVYKKVDFYEIPPKHIIQHWKDEPNKDRFKGKIIDYKEEVELNDLIKEIKEIEEAISSDELNLNEGNFNAFLNVADRITKLKSNLQKLDKSKPDSKDKEEIIKSRIATAELKMKNIQQKQKAEKERQKKDPEYKVDYSKIGKKEAVDNPYAIGMAAAMKATGDTPPLKKSTITKAHKIADKVKEEEVSKEKETEFHKKLDTLVHKTFGKRKDEKMPVKESTSRNINEGARALVEAIAALQKKADKTGMPYSILKQVYDRGMAAWKGGHRPGASQHQWAFARVNSFVTKSSGTWGGADSDLAKKVKGKE